MKPDHVFHLPLTFDAAPKASTRPFRGLAYAGGLMTNALGPCAVDLASLTYRVPMPLLLEHASSKAVGVITRLIASSSLEIEGSLFSDDEYGVIWKGDAASPKSRVRLIKAHRDPPKLVASREPQLP